jgi:3',5'-cyclic AMP phosphodiesterase CpdA
MRRFLALALLLVMAFSLMLISCGGDDATTTTGKSEEEIKELETKVEKLLESKHKLTFNDDGSFRVLILADTHMTVEADVLKIQELRNRIKLLVDREKPDLVIFTGDNTIRSSNEVILRRNLAVLVGYLEEKQILWCHVYGNHDHENALSKEEQQKIYESYEYCVSKTNPEGVYISGVGNYVNAVYNKDGSIGAVIYCLDSGTYAFDGYDYIRASQVSWYKETSELIQEYNGGKAVHGIMAFHIPLVENNVAYENRDNKEMVFEYTGERNEKICSSNIDSNLFETVIERGDIKAIVTGHDHVNDYMYNYKGVKLASSPNFSDLTYTSAEVQGARVFDLDLSTIDNVTTYVSYIRESAETN